MSGPDHEVRSNWRLTFAALRLHTEGQDLISKDSTRTVTMNFGDGLSWRKASRSGGNGGACVAVALEGGAVGVRDTKAGLIGSMLRLGRGNRARLVRETS